MKLLLIALVILSAVFLPAPATGQTKRNPFAPLVKTTVGQIPELAEPVDKDEEAVELKLNGIIWSKTCPVAIINDTVVEIGSQIAGRKVSEISITYVELEYYEKKEILRITPKFLFSISSRNETQNDINNSETK